MPPSIHEAAMPPSKDAACDKPRTSHFEVLQAVAVAHKMKDAAPNRSDSQHGTCDSQRLVAHDQELVRRRKPTTSRLIHLLKSVEVAHEVKDAAPGRQDTTHETSESHRLVAHDDVLVQLWRKPHTSLLTQPLDTVEVARGTLHRTGDSHRLVPSGHTILNFPEVLEGADERGHFADLSARPLSVQTEEATAATNKNDGDEKAPVMKRRSSIDAFSGKPAGKASSKDALRGSPSYCGWGYAFA